MPQPQVLACRHWNFWKKLLALQWTKEGNISLKGKQGVSVMIDGKANLFK
jgi:hypothetical protein